MLFSVLWLSVEFCGRFHGSSKTKVRVHPLWLRSCVTESMSALTDPATHGILNSELTTCPRMAAVLGELAAQWQQMMATLQRVERETVSSQSLANALRTDGRRATPPEELVGNTPLEGFAREVAAWLGYVDLKHEAGKLIQHITKETVRATEAWTDGRHAEDEKHVELDEEFAVSLANVTEGAARSTVLKVTQVEPSHGFVTWQAPEDGSAPKSSDDPSYCAATHTYDT